MTFLNDTHFNWQHTAHNGSTLYAKGDQDFANSMHDITNHAADIKTLEKTLTKQLESQNYFTCGVIETPTHMIAWVDHIRSWPLYYTNSSDYFLISNNARKIRDQTNIQNIDINSCIEFSMSGYVTGKHTLYKDISCLQPGEFLIWDKNTNTLSTTRYHQYTPIMTDKEQSIDENKKKLNNILDRSTLNMIERANGRPIWVPLSGGLDSRILLCKLHEHGYQNIHCFTYGPTLNFESGIAKKVAKTLNVPWTFISPSKRQIQRYFNSQDRKDFWYKTDGFKAIASMREFSALMNLREKKIIPKNAILLNGQSGDYITGNHISKDWHQEKNRNEQSFYNVLIKKHYDLWKTLISDQNIDTIKKRITNLLPNKWDHAKTTEEWSSLEEIWEYDARQICLVANGQRSYDYFGYDWEMPLWEKELVDFCKTLPLEQKMGQSLYKEYLKDYNYKGLFPQKEPYIWRWQVPMLWVVPFAQLIHLLKGRQAKNNFYALMRYHGHYSNQFYSFPWNTHKKTYDIARNVMSLNVRHWIKENHEILPDHILKALRIDNVD